MSPRIKRQDVRRAAGFRPKPYSLSDENRSKRHHKSSSGDEDFHASPTKKDHVKSTTDSCPNLGMPSRAQYKCIEEEYLRSLHVRKQEKALLTQDLFDKIWDVLHEPLASRVGTPQFRWWVRKMFVLSYTRSAHCPTDILSAAELDSLDNMGVDATPVVLHENRPVALKEQIYDVLCYCHDLAKHGGRDKTTAVIREHYSWIPKELIAQFVKACPTCIYKKTGNADLALATRTNLEGAEGDNIRAEGFPSNEDQRLLSLVDSRSRAMAHSVSLPVSDLLNRDATASPHYVPTRFWPPTSGPVHSPIPIHPMPALQRWMNPSNSSQDTRWSSSHGSEGGSTLVGDLPSELAQNKLLYELPPMRKFASADQPYGMTSSCPSGITLPPLTRVLSEGARGFGEPFLPPQVDNRDDTGISPLAASNSLVRRLFGDAYSRRLRNEAATGGITPALSESTQIDPALLQQDDVFRVAYYAPFTSQQYSLPSLTSFEHTSVTVALTSPEGTPRTTPATQSLPGSTSLVDVTLHSGSFFDLAISGARDTSIPETYLQGDSGRFIFPTSTERHAGSGYSFSAAQVEYEDN